MMSLMRCKMVSQTNEEEVIRRLGKSLNVGLLCDTKGEGLRIGRADGKETKN